MSSGQAWTPQIGLQLDRDLTWPRSVARASSAPRRSCLRPCWPQPEHEQGNADHALRPLRAEAAVGVESGSRRARSWVVRTQGQHSRAQTARCCASIHGVARQAAARGRLWRVPRQTLCRPRFQGWHVPPPFILPSQIARSECAIGSTSSLSRARLGCTRSVARARDG